VRFEAEVHRKHVLLEVTRLAKGRLALAAGVRLDAFIPPMRIAEF